MRVLKTIWAWLDGNKTIICAIIVSFASQSFAREWFGVNTCNVIIWIFGPAGVLSLIHHGAKGYFKAGTN